MSAPTTERGGLPVVAAPAQRDLYRILLLRKNGLEVLVVGDRRPFTFPCVEIPTQERVAENITAAIRQRYGISAVCLFIPELSATTTNNEQPRYQVMETREAGVSAPEGTNWFPVDSFSDQFFANLQDSLAAAKALQQIHELESKNTVGPFGKPGWIDELFAWAQHEIDPYGLRLSGEVRQLNASPTFALLRMETNGQAVWFKAVGEPNLREFPISVALSSLFPGFVTNVIATHPAWNGWLATEFAGSTLDEVPDAGAWERAAQTLGELQIASLGKTDQLLGAGCRDLGVTFLLRLVDPFMDVMSRLMEQQRKTPPPPILAGGDLRALGNEIKEALSELAELGIPDTLGHLDFNPRNILCSRDQCVFLDWAEGAIGHPFLTFQYLLEHLTRLRPESLAQQKELASSYAGAWEGIASELAISRSLSLAPLAAVFAHAVSAEAWLDQKRLASPQIAGYFRSLARRMKREADALADRSPECKFA